MGSGDVIGRRQGLFPKPADQGGPGDDASVIIIRRLDVQLPNVCRSHFGFSEIVLDVEVETALCRFGPASSEGRFAIVTDVERGMRWTCQHGRRTVLTRTAKSCGPGASMVASSLRLITQATVTTSPITGEITKETVKTIARGMPGVSGVTVVTMLVCFFHLHMRLRAHRASGIPCAL